MGLKWQHYHWQCFVCLCIAVSLSKPALPVLCGKHVLAKTKLNLASSKEVEVVYALISGKTSRLCRPGVAIAGDFVHIYQRV